MKLLENEELQRIVDYSFGDQSGVLGGVSNAYMKKANLQNQEFKDRIDDVFRQGRSIMTLFVDNIRLYRRPLKYSDWMHLKPISDQDRVWLEQFEDEDLLAALGKLFSSMKFVIFTAFEDTPLDEEVFNRIPPNVLGIYSANGVMLGEKVHPFPHGIERKMYEGYDHHEILQNLIEVNVEPHRQLFICHREDTGNRGNIRDIFKGKEWATVAPKLEYASYLKMMRDHKFVLCPSGNGIESARNWETLYMRRVPIFKRHPYLEEMFKGFPCLFIDDWSEITEELLSDNEQLFQEAQIMDMNKLDLDYWFNKSANA